MGWLGWTEEQALRSDMNAIELAWLGRIEMLEVMGFVKRNQSQPISKGRDGQSLELSPRSFDTVFGPTSRRVQ